MNVWPPSAAPRVLYRDADVLVVDKPAHLVCQAVDPARPHDDLPSAIARTLAVERGLPASEVYLGTHQRLDRETSGAILYTLERASNPAIAEQFAQREIEKVYVAAVSGKPPAPGTLLVDHLAPAEHGLQRIARAGERDAKQARTRILAVRTVGPRSLLTLALETGRTHQVRLQLSAAGCPIAGDARYGGALALRLMLHAERLTFKRPSDQTRVEVLSPRPREIDDWLEHGARPAFSDPALIARAIELACWRRTSLLRAHRDGETNVYRLLNGEADGVPGFSVDVYDRWLVVRVDGDDRASDERRLIEALATLGCAGIYLKRHPKQANHLVDPNTEQVSPGTPQWGEPAPDSMIVREAGLPFEVRLADGLRTGLFLDQRDNRARLRALAKNKRVLNLFGYTGSFSVAALVGEAAAVTTVDASRTAIAWAERNATRVGHAERHRAIADDVFDVLRRWSERGERFDCVILDPPSYSTTKRRRFRAISDYAELCAQALSLLDEGGSLLACINHQGVSRAGLRRFVHEAVRACGRELASLRDLPSGVDFPSALGREPDMKSLLAELTPRGTLSAGRASSKGQARRRVRSQKTRH